MAIIDVIKCEVNNTEFVYKFPSDDLKLGTQLVVYPAQTALFIKGGKIYDAFTEGTYTLKTENIPLLNKIINLPFGSKSPFKAEVWFINQVTKLDIKWGTPQPIQLEDPRYNIIVPVRAFGQYGIRVANPRLFLESLIGNMTSFNAQVLHEYFKGKILSQLSSLISKKIAFDNTSILEINAELIAMSEYCQEQLNAFFEKYGIEMVDFSIVSINVPKEDPSIIKIKEAKDLAARLKITGKDTYQMERSFDVLEKAASNEGTGGQILTMGAGLGVGLGVGSSLHNMTSQMVNTNPASVPPPIPQATTYFLYINGQQLGNQTIQSIQTMLAQGVINKDTLVWTQGMSTWIPLSQVPELAPLVVQQTPPPIPPSI